MKTITNRQTWIKYGRKNGLQALQHRIDELGGYENRFARQAAQEAHNYLYNSILRKQMKGR